MDHSELVERIDQLPMTSWQGAAWRHVSTSRAAMSGEGARLMGGRWNPPRSFAVLYLGLQRRTVMVEFHRLATRQRIDPRDFLPRMVYEYSVLLHELLDLRPTRAQGAVGLTPADVTADDAAACRAVGEAALAAGREGILAPSATGEGEVLAIYLERLGPDSSVSAATGELWKQASDVENV